MVSIVVALYNKEKYIRACLQSILSQSFKEIEVVVVNDGSTDHSLKIVEEFSDKDERIKIVTKKNSGLSAARNTGIETSTGEFLMFVDADDELENGAIEKLYTLITRDNSDISIGSASVIYDAYAELKDDDSWYFSIKHKGLFGVTDEIIDNLYCTSWGKMYRRSIIEKYNLYFPEGLNYEDAYWHWTYITSSNSISCIKDVVYKYYRRKESIMSSTLKKTQGLAIQHLYIIEKIFDFWAKNNTLENHYKISIKIFEKYFWLSIKYSQSFEKVEIAYNATRIARKYNLLMKENIFITNIYNGNYNFLFCEKTCDNMIENYRYLFKIILLINYIFPKGSRRSKIFYTSLKNCYRLIKFLKR